MDYKIKSDSAKLEDLLELFGETISAADINASRYLGEISSAIVKKRMELNMTQKEFAKHIKVSQGMISKWEGGDYNFSIKSLAELAEKLDIELYVNLKSPRIKKKEQKTEKKQAYIYIKSERTIYNKSIKSNIIKFVDKQNYINEKKKVYSPESIEM